MQINAYRNLWSSFSLLQPKTIQIMSWVASGYCGGLINATRLPPLTHHPTPPVIDSCPRLVSSDNSPLSLRLSHHHSHCSNELVLGGLRVECGVWPFGDHLTDWHFLSVSQPRIRCGCWRMAWRGGSRPCCARTCPPYSSSYWGPCAWWSTDRVRL